MSEPFLLDSDGDLIESVGDRAIKRTQLIPQSFIDDIKRERADSITTPAGDTLYRVARIPTVVIDKWYREGFDYQRASAREILAKLAKDQLDAFIATKKRI
jgi:methyl coenzyme M reductase alpha subunit